MFLDDFKNKIFELVTNHILNFATNPNTISVGQREDAFFKIMMDKDPHIKFNKNREYNNICGMKVLVVTKHSYLSVSTETKDETI